jgi:hypothetical protein
MFHGAYMIIRARHNIKPNNMTTWFTGTRIRAIETPVIDVAEAFMSLIETLDMTNVTGSKNAVVYKGTGSGGNRGPKNSILCNTIKKNKLDFNDTLKLVINNLEGAYCSGGIKCGSDNSGETLWGLDRLNHEGPFDNAFWTLIDTIKNTPKKWNSAYPKPENVSSQVYEAYSKIIKKDYDNFSRQYIKNETLKNLIESDGRLFFNMIYAVYNGAAWFKGFAKILQENYDNGINTAEGLLKIFVDERVSGGYNAFYKGTGKNLNSQSGVLIANTGVDIQKMVGLYPLC